MDQFGNVVRNTNYSSLRLRRKLSIFAISGIAAVVVACGGADDDLASTVPANSGGGEQPAAAAPNTTATTEVVRNPTVEPSATPEPLATVESVESPTPNPDFEDIFSSDAEKSRAATLRTIWGWNTNLAERTIPLTELSIVLGKDRITPIDFPNFISVSDAPDYMEAREPVVAVIVDGDARAYPLAILMWHEIVNDTVGGEPVTVTFCPLCNTGITFSRIVDGEELTFGTSGMLRNSDLVMWDRQSESYWQQITGEALAGDYAANETVLTQLPSSIIAWETFAETYPDGRLLERVVGDSGGDARPYDSPPYAGYDNVDDQPFLFRGSVDGRLVATSRVLTIDGEIPVAYPFSFLEESTVINDSVDGSEIVAFFDDGTFSAFNDVFDEHQTSGSVAVFDRNVDGRTLTFKVSGNEVTDNETGSSWNVAGVAVSGEFEGTQLEPVVHANHFWFAWAVFKPATVIRDSLDDLTAT